jgi:hypothetical protein
MPDYARERAMLFRRNAKGSQTGKDLFSREDFDRVTLPDGETYYEPVDWTGNLPHISTDKEYTSLEVIDGGLAVALGVPFGWNWAGMPRSSS